MQTHNHTHIYTHNFTLFQASHTHTYTTITYFIILPSHSYNRGHTPTQTERYSIHHHHIRHECTIRCCFYLRQFRRPEVAHQDVGQLPHEHFAGLGACDQMTPEPIFGPTLVTDVLKLRLKKGLRCNRCQREE